MAGCTAGYLTRIEYAIFIKCVAERILWVVDTGSKLVELGVIWQILVDVGKYLMEKGHR